MPESDTPEAVRLYREYYNETGAFENSVYPGIPELLTKLNANGKRLAVATSKVDYAALAILRHFNLDHHFDVIAGSDETGELRGTKALVIEHALAEQFPRLMTPRISLCRVSSRHQRVERPPHRSPLGARQSNNRCPQLCHGEVLRPALRHSSPNPPECLRQQVGG